MGEQSIHRAEVYQPSHLWEKEGTLRLIPRLFSQAEPRASSSGSVTPSTAMTLVAGVPWVWWYTQGVVGRHTYQGVYTTRVVGRHTGLYTTLLYRSVQSPPWCPGCTVPTMVPGVYTLSCTRGV